MYPKIHRVPLTEPIIQLQIDVTLEYDLIFINGMPFLTSKIRKIEFRSIERTKYSGNKTILQGVRIVIEKYQEIGLKVTGNRSNNKLKWLKTDILDASVDIVAKNEHPGSAEKSICT